MERIKNESDTLPFWTICAALVDEDEKISEIVKEDGQYFNIEFKVNGVEVSFEKIIKAYNKNYEANVLKKAKDLILEKAYDLTDKLDKMCDNVEIVLECTDTETFFNWQNERNNNKGEK